MAVIRSFCCMHLPNTCDCDGSDMELYMRKTATLYITISHRSSKRHAISTPVNEIKSKSVPFNSNSYTKWWWMWWQHSVDGSNRIIEVSHRVPGWFFFKFKFIPWFCLLIKGFHSNSVQLFTICSSRNLQSQHESQSDRDYFEKFHVSELLVASFTL